MGIKNKFHDQRPENNDGESDEIEILDTDDDLKIINECWHISIRSCPKFFKYGMDPQTLFRYLSTLGKIERIKYILDGLPAFEEYDPEMCYIGFEIDYKCEKNKKEIESAFEFVRDDCKMRILPPNSNISDYIELIEDLPEENKRIGEILKEIGSLTDLELEEILNIQKEIREYDKDDKQCKPIGELLLSEKIIQKSVLNAALIKQKKIRKKITTIRIDPDKLSGLINLISELETSGTYLKQLSELDNLEKRKLIESISVISQLIASIRESALNIQMSGKADTLINSKTK